MWAIPVETGAEGPVALTPRWAACTIAVCLRGIFFEAAAGLRAGASRAARGRQTGLAMNDTATKYSGLVERFVKLANEMKNEGHDTGMISDALMFSSGVYATFVAAGNEGGLTDTGVKKVTAAYEERLRRIQEMKKAEAKAAADA